MFYYSLHKETILRPAPRCITVRYRKGNGLNCWTREKIYNIYICEDIGEDNPYCIYFLIHINIIHILKNK
jgi:hypothetical protein